MIFRLLEGYTITEDGDRAETFGVIVFPECVGEAAEHSCNTPASVLYSNADITFNRREMLRHISLWNELQPTLMQLRDLIADIIESNYTST